MNKISILFFTFLIVCRVGYSQEQLLTEVQQIADKYKAIGVSFAVVKDNKLVYDAAIGSQNLENQIPLDSKQSLFRIASISKSFTSTAIMQLVDAGLISLDDDFSDLVGFTVRNPNYPDKVITLRMILSHTSSINDVNGYFELDVIKPDVNTAWRKSYSNNEPGTTYDYCNLNYNLTGAVLEKITGVRFDQYIKDQILNPLALEAGYCVDSLDQSRFAQLYSYSADKDSFTVQPSAYNPRSEEIKKYQIGISTPVFSPTGGLKISTLDLAKYMQMHMNYGTIDNKQIISKKSSKLMQTKVSEKEGYGLALRQVENLIDNKVMIGHTGSAYGLYSSMFFCPKEKFGIVVITNGCNAVYEKGQVLLLKEIANLLYTRIIE